VSKMSRGFDNPCYDEDNGDQRTSGQAAGSSESAPEEYGGPLYGADHGEGPHQYKDHDPQDDAAFPTDLERLQRIDNDGKREKFSLRQLWMFTGPGWLMSIAYLDPGNIESDLQSGVVAGYKLLWVTLWASFLGFLMQRLSARLGTVTGKHLAEICHESFPRIPNVLLWIMVEIAVIGSDIQEVIGTAIALYLLTKEKLPLWAGCIVTLVDTFTFLFLDRYGRRKLEFFFAFLIMVMAVSFGINYGADLPDQGQVALGTIVPGCSGCDSTAFLQAVAAVGAIIMPHNLYLHSALVTKNEVDRTKASKIRSANFYTTLESGISIGVSFIINLIVVSVFGQVLHNRTYGEINQRCIEKDWYPEMFNCTLNYDDCTANSTVVDADLYKGGIALGCSFGSAYTYIWALGILASGQSSTMTGTYAGQFAMQGFLNLKWPQWKILVITRCVAMAPTLFVAGFTDIQTLTGLNDILNTVMSIQLPFAIIPCLCFTSSRLVMGQFKNSLPQKIIICLLSVIVLAINMIFVFQYVNQTVGYAWYYLVPIVVYFLAYFVFVAYLSVYLFICLGFEQLTKYEFLQKIYKLEKFLEVEENP